MLLADIQDLQDSAWSYLVWDPAKEGEVPHEYHTNVVIASINNWLCSTRLNTTILAKCFHDILHVTMVNSKFINYRDVFVFGRMVAGGLQIQSFELSTEQSEATFSVAKTISKAQSRGQTSRATTS